MGMYWKADMARGRGKTGKGGGGRAVNVLNVRPPERSRLSGAASELTFFAFCRVLLCFVVFCRFKYLLCVSFRVVLCRFVSARLSAGWRSCLYYVDRRSVTMNEKEIKGKRRSELNTGSRVGAWRCVFF